MGAAPKHRCCWQLMLTQPFPEWPYCVPGHHHNSQVLSREGRPFSSSLTSVAFLRLEHTQGLLEPSPPRGGSLRKGCSQGVVAQ